MHSKIASRRTEILLGNPSMSKVGAYAKALAELWAEANQELWESEAASIPKDIYGYVPLNVTSYHFKHRVRNRERLEQALYPCLRGLCQGGQLGNMGALLLLSYRDSKGRVATSL
jgi:hypothetical protein